MATLALMGAGSALGGAVLPAATASGAAWTFLGLTGAQLGGVVGSLAGSLVDSQLVLPALMSKTIDLKGSRIDDIQAQQGAEGSPIKWLLGPECPAAGTVIWASDAWPEQRTEVHGGKGGGGSAVVETSHYRYYQHFAVALGESPIAGGIESVDKIWADNELIYEADTTNLISSATDISATVFKKRLGFGPKTSSTLYQVFLRLEAPNGGSDLSQFRSGFGYSLTVAGFSVTGNNGTWQLAPPWPYTGTGTVVDLFIGFYTDADIPVGDDPSGDSVTLTQTLSSVDIYTYDTLAIYKGTSTQAADNTIESVEGSGNVPAWRGLVYVVFNRFDLTRYSKRIPQIRALCKTHTSLTLASAIGLILGRHGLTASDYDVTNVAGNFRGYPIAGPQTGVSMLDPLLMAYDLTMQEVQGVLTFNHRGSEDAITVTASDLGCAEAGNEHPPKLDIQDVAEERLPSKVVVQYISTARNYEQGSQPATRPGPVAESVQTIELPLVLSDSEAAEIADRRLWSAYAERRPATASLPPSYVHGVAGDIFNIPRGSETYAVRSERVTRGLSGRIEVEGVAEESYTHTQTPTVQNPNQQFAGLYLPQHMAVAVFEFAPLRDEHVGVPGFYYAASRLGEEGRWDGAQLLISADGSNWTLGAIIEEEAVMGFTEGALGQNRCWGWDKANTVDISLYRGSLESKSAAEVLAGANRMVVGNEVIGFQTATLLTDRRYRLSNLLRGLFDTEISTDGHETNERTVLMNPLSVGFYEMNLGQKGRLVYFKFLPNNSVDPDDVASFSMQFDADTIRTTSPHLHAQFDLDRVFLNPIPRTRRVTRLFERRGGPPAPGDYIEGSTQGQYVQKVRIDVMDPVAADPDAVVRTWTIEITPDNPDYDDYLQGNMTTDGFTGSDAIDARIYQFNEVTGWGRGSPKYRFFREGPDGQ